MKYQHAVIKISWLSAAVQLWGLKKKKNLPSHHLSQAAAVNHQTLACCRPAVCGVASYLRYLCKLSVGLAALVCRLHSDLIVIHEGPVHSELAGLQERGHGLVSYHDTRQTLGHDLSSGLKQLSAIQSLLMCLCRCEPLIFCLQQQTLRWVLFHGAVWTPVRSALWWSRAFYVARRRLQAVYSNVRFKIIWALKLEPEATTSSLCKPLNNH